MIRVRVASNRLGLARNALTGAVASIIGRVAIELDKHRIINLTTERAFNRLQVGSVAVCRKLYAIFQPARKIIDELMCGNRVTPSVMPARNKLRISVNRNPGPNVANAKHALLFNRDVLFFGINEAPNFVTLKATARKIAKHFVLIL